MVNIILALIVVANASSSKNEAENRFRSEYPSAVEAIAKRAFNQSIKIQIFEFERGTKKLYKTIDYKSGGENQLVNYWFESELKKHGPMAKRTFVFGPTKSFRVHETWTGEYVAVSASPRGEIDTVLTDVAEPVFAPFAPLGGLLGGKSLLDGERLGKVEILSITSDKEEIVVDWKLKTSDQFTGRSTFDPSRNWVATSHLTLSPTGEVIRARHIEYDPTSTDGVPTMRRIIGKVIIGKRMEETETIVVSVQPGAVPASEFTLTRFGLPESLGDLPKKSWRMRILALLASLALGILGWRMLRSKQNSRI